MYADLAGKVIQMLSCVDDGDGDGERDGDDGGGGFYGGMDVYYG